MDTLKNLSCELIRKNWVSYSHVFTPGSPYHELYYEFLWETWGEKYDVSLEDTHVLLIRNFIENRLEIKKDSVDSTFFLESQSKSFLSNKLIIKNLSSISRTTIHFICNKLGLKHKTVKSKTPNVQRTIKNIEIQKETDKDWSWEFTYDSIESNNENNNDNGCSIVNEDKTPPPPTSSYCIDCCDNSKKSTHTSYNLYQRQSNCEKCSTLWDLTNYDTMARFKRRVVGKRSKTV